MDASKIAFQSEYGHALGDNTECAGESTVIVLKTWKACGKVYCACVFEIFKKQHNEGNTFIFYVYYIYFTI